MGSKNILCCDDIQKRDNRQSVNLRGTTHRIKTSSNDNNKRITTSTSGTNAITATESVGTSCSRGVGSKCGAVSRLFLVPARVR